MNILVGEDRDRRGGLPDRLDALGCGLHPVAGLEKLLFFELGLGRAGTKSGPDKKDQGEKPLGP